MCETKLLQHWCEEVWNNANEDAIDKLMHESAVIHGLDTDKAKTGPAAFKPFYKNMRVTFPTVSVKVSPIVSAGGYRNC